VAAPANADYGLDAPAVVVGNAVGGIAALAVAQAGLMVRSSRAGKLTERDRLLDELPWRGDERVLDVGCGRGLLLIGAAGRHHGQRHC
jgi:hypothetical protein